ncbi:hypothetical protein ACJRO7_035261 [Eucalyptus globulus]|uniref:Uncharacterized protein n=1 Tax=Eucalyptus globulus TaxID=34317 RepID=A0ABD3J686_EUCGL
MPEEGWTMQDGTAWPGNNSRDHLRMIQVFLGHSGGLDTDGNELPRLVYVSREKRPGFQHHEKAGAMIALIRVSAVLTNGTYLLNVDCDHYFNNSKALKEAMCFMMDPAYGKKTCYVQFPQRFDRIDLHDMLTATSSSLIILELRWSGVSIEDWWRNEQFWVIGGTSAHLFAVFQGLLKVLAGIGTNFIVTSGYQSWGPLFGKLFFAIWVIADLYPFLKGPLGRQNRTHTIVIVWSILLASIFSLLWYFVV